MSDLSSPDERPPSPPVARRTRPKTRASTPRRTIQPAASPTNRPGAAKSTPSQAKAPAADPTPPAKPPKTPEQPEPEVVETAGDRFTYKVRNWTVTSKPILLWAAIVGGGSFIVAVGPGLIFTALGVTQKQLDSNPDLEGALGWITLLLSFGLPVLGGWRATVREGNWRQGGMTSFWGAFIFTILLLLYYVVYAAVTGELSQIDGPFFGSIFEGFVIQGLLGFGLGAMGGTISTWRRRRAQQAQEMLTSSS
ncbi:MAG TPA: hypothetical protein VKT82_26645 [Ktedonobacterales bacterium]|nr:hypothetical protein [Ktedonobacterales bacterium]